SGTSAPGEPRSRGGWAGEWSRRSRRLGWRESPRRLVDVAPREAPGHRTHDRMLRCPEMFGGVAVWRIVAAADVAACPALSERYPDRTQSGAFLARTWSSRRREVRQGQRVQMLTRCRHLVLSGSNDF